MSSKMLIYNEPGWELMQKFTAPMSIGDIERYSVNMVAGTGVRIYQMGLLTGHVAAVHRSRILEEYCALFDEPHKMHMLRLRETMRSLAAQGTDVLEIVSKRCHQLGIECHASIRINDTHHTYVAETPAGGVGAQGFVQDALRGIKFRHKYFFPDLRTPWLEENKHLWLTNGGALNFALAEVRDRKTNMIAEVLDNYEVDGIDLDFTRFRPFFEDDFPHKADVMTRWVENIRKLTEAASYRKGKRIKLTARVEYDPAVNYAAGLDVESWINKRLLDIVCLGVVGDATPDASAKWFIDLCKGTGCKVCPGLEGFFHWIGNDNGTMRNLTVENARAAAGNYYREGADGIQLFNLPSADDPWDRRLAEELADPERFALEDKHYVYTMWEGAIMCKNARWDSRFALLHGESAAASVMAVGDDFERLRQCGIAFEATLYTRIDGLNRKDDIALTINGVALAARERSLTQFAWDSFSVDRLEWTVPREALQLGDNTIELRRKRSYSAYVGHIEVQELELRIRFPKEMRHTQMV